MRGTEGLCARDYRRLSDDRGGNSIAEQGAGNEVSCKKHGMILGEPYIDSDRSASEFAERQREGYDKLIADLRARIFDADVLVLWQPSRGSRNPPEWVMLLELCKDTGVLIWVTVHERLYDLRNWYDYKVLLNEGIQSADESHIKSVTTRRAIDARVELGRPHGAPPYGYRPVYDQRGILENWIEDDAAPSHRSRIPKELFRLLEKGVSLYGVAVEFKERGWLNHQREFLNYRTKREPVPFEDGHLGLLARRAAYAGIRSHRDRDTGEVTERPATWKALVPPERFFAVRRILSDPKRRTVRDGRANHELTMILKCDVCLGPIKSIVAVRKRPTYRCEQGHVSVGKAGVDEIIIPAIIGYLSKPDTYRQFSAKNDSREVQRVREALAVARAARDDLKQAVPESTSHALILANGLEARLTEILILEERERTLTLPPVLAGILAASTDMERWWADADVSQRRQVARIVLQPHLLGEVRVTPLGRGPHVPPYQRLRWVRTDRGQPAP